MEETQTEAQSADQSVPQAPTLEALQATLAEERKTRESLEGKLKDLSGRLTKTQQENAETQRFLKATLPKINPMIEKSFSDQWEESPQKAVETQVVNRVDPLHREVQVLKAQTALATILSEHPEWAKHKSRVVELGDDPTLVNLTYTQAGIESLFKMARAEELEATLEKSKSNGNSEAAKERSFTEQSAARSAGKGKRMLNPHQRAVARNLGLKEEEYLKHLEESDAEAKETATRFDEEA